MRTIRLVKRVWAEFWQDRIPTVAAGITFFFLLALFPAITSIVSLYGILTHSRRSLLRALELLSGFLPRGTMMVLTSEIRHLIAQPRANLGLALLFSMVIALWSASGGVKAIIDGLNVAFERKETRGFLTLTTSAVGYTLLGVLAAAVAVYVALALSDVIDHSRHASLFQLIFNAVAWPLGLLICWIVFSLIYRYGPDRPRARWSWVSWGSGLASVVWIGATVLFGWYSQNIAHYDRTYGDLGAAVGFLTWVWLSLLILLTGAEIVSEIERAEAAHCS